MKAVSRVLEAVALALSLVSKSLVLHLTLDLKTLVLEVAFGFGLEPGYSCALLSWCCSSLLNCSKLCLCFLKQFT